jgi:hypothetical protein
MLENNEGLLQGSDLQIPFEKVLEKFNCELIARETENVIIIPHYLVLREEMMLFRIIFFNVFSYEVMKGLVLLSFLQFW